MKNKYLAMIKVGDLVKLNDHGVLFFGDTMLNSTAIVTKVYIDNADRNGCVEDCGSDHAANCDCYLRYDIKDLHSTSNLSEVVFDELDIVRLK